MPDLPALSVEAKLGQTLRQTRLVIPPGHRTGNPFELRRLKAQRLAGVTNRTLATIGDDGGGERGAIPPVFVIEVLDHLFAPLVFEIHIDVRRLVALTGNKAFEQHTHARRIDLGDAQRVTHRRIGGRTTALTQNAAAARKGDDILHGEKVWFVAQLFDQGQLARDQHTDLRRRAAGITPFQNLQCERGQIRRRGVSLRHQLFGIFITQAIERKITAPGNVQRFGEQCGRIQLRKAHTHAQMTLGVWKQRVLRASHRHAKAYRRQRILQGTPRTQMHMHVARRHQRQMRRSGQLLHMQQAAAIIRAAEQFSSNPQTPSEDFAQALRMGEFAGPGFFWCRTCIDR